MTQHPLRARVRRLEQQMAVAQMSDDISRLTPLQFVRRFFCGVRPPASPADRAATLLRVIDRGAELLAQPETDSSPNRKILESIAINKARRYLAGLRSLSEPDLPFAEVLAGPPHYDKPHHAWRHQQRLRELAAEYLAAVDLARGTYTPKAWPLPETGA